VIDLSAVTFLGSRGLAEIARLVREQPRDHWLRLAAPDTGSVAKVLAIGGFQGVVRTYDTVEAALADAPD
jgi:hypothetical protein